MTHKINLGNNEPAPAAISVQEGDQVEFNNLTGEAIRVIFAGGRSPFGDQTIKLAAAESRQAQVTACVSETFKYQYPASPSADGRDGDGGEVGSGRSGEIIIA